MENKKKNKYDREGRNERKMITGKKEKDKVEKSKNREEK